MMILKAPYPASATICILPDPEFENSERLQDEIQLKKAMNGTRYTYVNTLTPHIFMWSFVLLHDKAVELLEFMEKYVADKWQVTMHDDQIIEGYLLTNPSTVSMNGRAVYGTNTEYATVSLEFQGTIQ